MTSILAVQKPPPRTAPSLMKALTPNRVSVAVKEPSRTELMSSHEVLVLQDFSWTLRLIPITTYARVPFPPVSIRRLDLQITSAPLRRSKTVLSSCAWFGNVLLVGPNAALASSTRPRWFFSAEPYVTPEEYVFSFKERYRFPDGTYKFEMEIYTERNFCVDFASPDHELLVDSSDAACLEIEGKKLFVSRSFLCGNSSFFKQLFLEKEANSVIAVKNIKLNDFMEFLRQIYPQFRISFSHFGKTLDFVESGRSHLVPSSSKCRNEVDFCSPNHDLISHPADMGCLQIEGQKIYVSKSYLSAQSPYFKRLFYSDHFTEKNQDVVVLEDVKLNDFLEFLAHLYIQFNRSRDVDVISNVLALADMYLCDPVIRTCEMGLCRLNYDERFLVLCDRYGLIQIGYYATRAMGFDELHSYLERNPGCGLTRTMVAMRMETEEADRLWKMQQRYV